MNADDVKWDAQGLAPAIVQDASTGEVLMLAWMNRESLGRTLQTRKATFFSRSRNALWVKGETSGNTRRSCRTGRSARRSSTRRSAGSRTR